jgi:hypothetical protein
MTVTAQAVWIDSLSFAPTRVVGGRPIDGTVALTAPAPDGGAIVTLTAEDPLLAPAFVVVPAAAASQAIHVSTHVVGSTTQRTLTAVYGGSSASAIIEVTPSTDATARFGVTGPNLTETCLLADAGLTLNCTFHGSTSTTPGAIVAWDWSWAVATTLRRTTTGPVLSMPAMDCNLLPALPFQSGVDFFTMIVGLTIHDNLGNVSPEVTDTVVRLFPNGACGL